VLPFRVLRPDPETDFLAFSLPDAITTSLSGFGSLVVRSSAAAARYSGVAPDLKALAAEADVDRVVTGTLLRAGDQLQATAQLVEAPGGTLLTSHTVKASLGDLFQLQDEIARRVVEALSLPLTGSTPSPDRPRDAGAYALYLKANELARRYEKLAEARDVYQQCVERDPKFAPAWAQLGRAYRVVGKYIDASGDPLARSEEALRTALELNPRLAVAHKYLAALEADTGHAIQAMTRLLNEASRHGNDPELFAGLVHACRYCGLYDQSMAAHQEARRLDPNVPTSIEQTIHMTADFETYFGLGHEPPATGGDEVIRVVSLGLVGRLEEARAELIHLEHTRRIPAFQPWLKFLMAWLERRPDEMRTRRDALNDLLIMGDPEATFQEAWLFCDAGDAEHGLEMMRRSIEREYLPVPTLKKARAFDRLRGTGSFDALLGQAEAGRDRALTAFREAGGDRLLGL
jgi:TolB-like protein